MIQSEFHMNRLHLIVWNISKCLHKSLWLYIEGPTVHMWSLALWRQFCSMNASQRKHANLTLHLLHELAIYNLIYSLRDIKCWCFLRPHCGCHIIAPTPLAPLIGHCWKETFFEGALKVLFYFYITILWKMHSILSYHL